MDGLLPTIPLVPIGVAALLLVAAGVCFGPRRDLMAALKEVAGWVSVAGVLTATVLAVVAVLAYARGEAVSFDATWFAVGSLEVSFSLRLDGLQSIMVLVVAGVSLLVHLFSIGYMRHDRDVVVYFAELSLFSGAMLLLVLASNFFILYVAWELVGATSYLLISYYFERPAAAAAGKKAFLTTRLGDLGLLLAVFAIATYAGSLDFEGVFAWVEEGGFGGAWAVAVPLLIFAGAAGKSAQFPLHVWLPDAMEGPTPVSALIHAATMVAAGVYLVARTFPLFEAAPDALVVVCWIGGITALGAAVVAVTQRDIKKVLAYSTISQLGFMMAAMGAASPTAGIFHLFTHAWFKALLFLGAGSVIHAAGVQTVDQLGGLGRRMPVTAWTFTAAALALAGIPPFAGFFSKEEVLAAVQAEQPAVFVLLLVASLLTAFYIFRLVFLVFFGPGVGAASWGANGHGQGAREAHESPLVMTVPLIVLAAATLGAGLLGAGFLGGPLQGFLGLEEEAAHGVPLWITVVAVALGLSGVALAWFGYGRSSAAAPADGTTPDGFAGFDGRLQRGGGRFYRLVSEGYMLDLVYARALIAPVVAAARFLAVRVDLGLIDAFVDGVGRAAVAAGGVLRRLQSGEVRDYLAAMALGAVLVGALLLAGAL